MCCIKILQMSDTIDMSKITDAELIKEFRKRYLVIQFHSKRHIELLVNEQEEISQEKYERFKDYCYNTNYYNEIDEAVMEMWDNFNEEEEEVNGVCAGCGCEGKYLKDVNDTDPCWYCLDCSSI